jgi:hypothetical protein
LDLFGSKQEVKKFGITLKQPLGLDNFIYRDLYIDEEIDLLRFLIKHGDDKIHSVTQLMKHSFKSGEYTNEEKTLIGKVAFFRRDRFDCSPQTNRKVDFFSVGPL